MESKEEVKIIDKGDANNEDYVTPGWFFVKLVLSVYMASK